jgi:hypothetical protein
VRFVGVFHKQRGERVGTDFLQHGGSGLAAFWIHAHIQRSFETNGKTSGRIIKLPTGNTQISQETIYFIRIAQAEKTGKMPEIMLNKYDPVILRKIGFGCRILIKYDGTTLATGNVNLSGPFRRVSIDVAAGGAIAVSVNGTVAVSATLPAGYLSATKTAWQFAFGSKTGGSTNKHSLRNFSIARPRGLPAGLALDPVTGRLSGTLTNSAVANYPLTLVATNAFGATVRDVTLANGPLSNLSPTFAAGTDIGLAVKSFDATPFKYLKHVDAWLPQLANRTYLEMEQE